MKCQKWTDTVHIFPIVSHIYTVHTYLHMHTVYTVYFVHTLPQIMLRQTWYNLSSSRFHLRLIIYFILIYIFHSILFFVLLLALMHCVTYTVLISIFHLFIYSCVDMSGHSLIVWWYNFIENVLYYSHSKHQAAVKTCRGSECAAVLQMALTQSVFDCHVPRFIHRHTANEYTHTLNHCIYLLIQLYFFLHADIKKYLCCIHMQGEMILSKYTDIEEL